MAITYFGLCDAAGTPTFAGTDTTSGAYATWNNNGLVPFTCPGSGSQTVRELTADVHIGSGTPNIRCAIYSADGVTLIYQGATEVAVVGAADTWQGHSGATLATVTGGLNYLLVMGPDGNVATDHAKGASGGFYYAADYTTGFPVSLPAGTGGSVYPVRCGVEPAYVPPPPSLVRLRPTQMRMM